MGQFTNKILAEFQPPKKWKLGRDLVYTTSDLYANEEDKELIKNAKVAADKVFLLAMKDAEPKVSGWKIYSAWKAVDLFGRWSIKPNEKNI